MRPSGGKKDKQDEQVKAVEEVQGRGLYEIMAARCFGIEDNRALMETNICAIGKKTEKKLCDCFERCCRIN